MRPALLITTVALSAVAGCGKDTPERVAKDYLAALDEAASALEQAKDHEAGAAPRIEAAAKRIVALAKRKAALPRPQGELAPLTPVAMPAMDDPVQSRYDKAWMRTAFDMNKKQSAALEQAIAHLSSAQVQYATASSAAPNVPPGGPPFRRGPGPRGPGPGDMPPPPPGTSVAEMTVSLTQKFGRDKVVSITVDGVPSTKHLQVFARLKALPGVTNSSTSGSGSRVTAVLAPVPDLDVVVGKIDFGRITSVDRSQRSIGVACDPSKLP